jgi:hypothetical protein
MPKTLTRGDIMIDPPEDTTAYYDGFIGADDRAVLEAAPRRNALDIRRLGVFATLGAEQLQQILIPPQLGRVALAS